MKLLTMKGPMCMVYSSAMALGCDPQDICDYLGHNGMDEWWPEIPKPGCYRSFHIQEIITYAINVLQIGLVPIEVYPNSRPNATAKIKTVASLEVLEERFINLISGRIGILIGENVFGQPHAVAWNEDICYDPVGQKYLLEKFTPRECWIISHL